MHYKSALIYGSAKSYLIYKAYCGIILVTKGRYIMKIRRITALFCTFALTLGVAGCGGENAVTETTEVSKTEEVSAVEDGAAKTYPASADYTKLLGRAYYDGSELICAYSGTGCEFTFTGTKAEIAVKGDSAAKTGNDDNNARLAVYVDGERVIDEMLTESEHTYTAFESDAEKTVTISLVKLSETAQSTFSVTGITVEGGEIAPTPDKDLYIEFVGDSITCGYGVDDEDRDHHFSTTTEDCTRAYAYKTAQLLDADYSLVSISGYGVISGYTNDPSVKSEQQIMPLYYDKIGFSYARSDVSDIEWGFERQPDVIVINLGTNDESYTKTDADKMAEFGDAYIEFVKHIREKNPDAKILCTLGVMGNTLARTILTQVKAYNEETGDTNVYAMALAPQNQADGYAADWHPTEATHTKVSVKVADKIKEILGE